MEDFYIRYTNEVCIALNKLDPSIIHMIVSKIVQCHAQKKMIFFIGNGGSSATPSHSAGDWAKELKIKTICLTDNTPAITAFANDTAYSNIFKGQLETFLGEGDVLIAYSGSGNSPNIINAVIYAKSMGNTTIGITGNYKNNQGGKLAKIADISLVVPTTSMEIIEDIHLIVNHIIKEFIKEKSMSNSF